MTVDKLPSTFGSQRLHKYVYEGVVVAWESGKPNGLDNSNAKDDEAGLRSLDCCVADLSHMDIRTRTVNQW
jgi:hypothetical protein